MIELTEGEQEILTGPSDVQESNMDQPRKLGGLSFREMRKLEKMAEKLQPCAWCAVLGDTEPKAVLIVGIQGEPHFLCLDHWSVVRGHDQIDWDTRKLYRKTILPEAAHYMYRVPISLPPSALFTNFPTPPRPPPCRAWPPRKEIEEMTTMRFTKEPGSPVMESVEEPAVLIADGPPDDVRLPPELGGQIERVQSHFMGPCPHCRAHVRHLVLETCSVAECNRFYWYRPREDNDQ